MSEITLSEAERNYNAARLHLENLSRQEGVDESELNSADIAVIEAKLTFTGLGGRLLPAGDNNEQLNREKEEILAKLNSHS